MLHIHITFRYLFIHQNPSSLQHIFSIGCKFFFPAYIKSLERREWLWQRCDMKSVTPRLGKEREQKKLPLYCVVNKDVYLLYTFRHVTAGDCSSFLPLSCNFRRKKSDIKPTMMWHHKQLLTAINLTTLIWKKYSGGKSVALRLIWGRIFWYGGK